MNKTLKFLNQIIGISLAQDKQDHPNEPGESAVTFHLKVLKDLIKEEFAAEIDKIKNAKSFQEWEAEHIENFK